MKNKQFIIPYLTVLLTILGLVACQTPTTPIKQVTTYPPSSFFIKAKVSLLDQNLSHLFSFLWIQKSNKAWSINIEHLSLPWELNIIFENETIWVNNQIIHQNIDEYLKQEYQFNLPIDLLKKLIFFPVINKQAFNYQGWKVIDINTQFHFKNPVANRLFLKHEQSDKRLLFKILKLDNVRG